MRKFRQENEGDENEGDAHASMRKFRQGGKFREVRMVAWASPLTVGVPVDRVDRGRPR